MGNKTTIDRDYIDNFSVKEFVTEEMVPKYFEDIDVNLRSISMVGFTTEMITNTCEDAFNTGSVLFRESFVNRAQTDESIYSHAAIFQLDDVFSHAASCSFLLVMEEESIIKNMERDPEKDNKNIFYFYIDKNTTIYVEDVPYTLDYDVVMTIVRKVSETGDDYIFTARYIMEEYENSLSDVSDPYVKIRRSKDGFLALQLQTHQCIRDERDEMIITNSEINYPVFDFSYNGKLAGFDVLYKDPLSNEYVQMQTFIVHSQPIKSPFCYYQIMEEGTLRITFNTKDTYFVPEFNSNLKIILYMTEGKAGNFDIYEGNNIVTIPNSEKWAYANSYIVASKPIGASKNGADESDPETLQALATEGYRTANALTTDNDLSEYFNNYKYRYADTDILFIKKRDDIFERVFSAFIILRNGSEVYKTNTLNLLCNLYDLTAPEKDIFLLEPGTVFTANTTSGYAEYYRNTEKHDEYYQMYLEAIAQGTTPFIEDVQPEEIPPYLGRPCSFAQFKERKGLDDKISVWDLTEEDYEMHDNPSASQFLLINPFLIKFTKSPNLMSTYMTYVDNASSLDFINQNSDMYLQFTMYTLYLSRRFEKEKKYSFYVNVGSTVNIDTSKYPLVVVDSYDEDGTPNYHLNDRYSVVKNDLRIVLGIYNDSNELICFTELYPTEYSKENNNFKFSGTIFTDDHLTSGGYLRILQGVIYRNDETGDYYKEHEHDPKLYYHFSAEDILIEDDVPVDQVTGMIASGVLHKWCNVYNTGAYDDTLVPIDDVTVRIFPLYNRNYSESEGKLIPIDPDQANNIFIEYDSRFKGFIWTNEYSTSSEPVTFIKSLTSVRSYLDFLDFTEAKYDEEGKVVFAHDIYDVEIRSLSFLRAQTIINRDVTDHFFKTFFNNYLFLENIINTRLRNATGLDIKFYNTYGRSRDFIIGEGEERLDTVNLRLDFDVWYVQGTDVVNATPEVKRYIKNQIEVVNNKGMNNLYISNLMRKVENNFAYVDHIRFKEINYYDSTYQAVKNYVTDLDELTVEERRWYVPELLVSDIEDININEYYAS